MLVQRRDEICRICEFLTINWTDLIVTSSRNFRSICSLPRLYRDGRHEDEFLLLVVERKQLNNFILPVHLCQPSDRQNWQRLDCNAYVAIHGRYSSRATFGQSLDQPG